MRQVPPLAATGHREAPSAGMQEPVTGRCEGSAVDLEGGDAIVPVVGGFGSQGDPCGGRLAGSLGDLGSACTAECKGNESLVSAAECVSDA